MLLPATWTPTRRPVSGGPEPPRTLGEEYAPAFLAMSDQSLDISRAAVELSFGRHTRTAGSRDRRSGPLQHDLLAAANCNFWPDGNT